MMTTTLAPLAALLLTYVIHSTLLLGGAWVLDRLVIRREAWRETLWKTALIGGLFTTAAGAMLPARVAARVEIAALTVSPEAVVQTGGALNRASTPSMAGPASNEPAAPVSPATRSAQAGGAEQAARDGVDDQGEPAPIVLSDAELIGAPAADRRPAGARPPSVSGVPAAAEASTGAVPWVALLIGAWAAVAALLLIRLGIRHYRLRRVLRGRRKVVEAGLPAMLAELRRTAALWGPVRLTVSDAIGTPLVLGSREICVPERLLAELSEEERRAALAHELGHLARRDPAWQLAAMLLECVFFFQPLHRLARLRLRESAEYLADSWAVEQTGSRLGLARCLAQVAGWGAPSDEPVVAGTVAMAEGGSPLLVRVNRLLEREPEASPRPGLRAAAALAIILFAAGFVPAVTPASVAGVPGSDQSAAMASDEDSNSDAETDPGADAGTEVDGDEEQAPSSPAERAQQGQEVNVVRVPVDGDLAGRLRWARQSASALPGEPYWVAWAVPSALPPRMQVSRDSRGGVDLRVRLDEDALLGNGEGVAAMLGVADEVEWEPRRSDVIVLALMSWDDRTVSVDRLALRSPGMPASISGRVFWLGRIEPDQGVDWLADLYREWSNRRVALHALGAVAVHASERAPVLLRAVAQDQIAGRAAREQAVEGLAYHPEDENLDLLVRIAATEGDLVLRSEAVETIGEMDNRRAGRELRRFLRASDARVRNQALESLAEGPQDTALVATLVDVALNAPDRDLRGEAVELIGELPPSVALPALRRISRDSRDREVLREVAETLGEVATPEALDALDEIVAGSPDPEVVKEALEAIADGYPAEVAVPRLEAVVDKHRDTRIRREALDQLIDLRVSTASADVLLELALHDRDPDLRREAVEKLADLPAEEAVPRLRRVAFESGDGEAERQAAESLGEVGTLEALAVLDQIIARSPSEEAALQAVESIAENFSRDLSVSRLRRILREHPSSSLRHEAFEQLEDLGGAVDPNPSRDPDGELLRLHDLLAND